MHWPYCAAICPYCAFNVYRDRGENRSDLVAAIAADIDGWRARTGPRAARSIYFGGGTPSRMNPADVERLIHAATGAWPLESGGEITLETNPDDTNPELLAAFRAAGVTRLSLGVQAFDDGALSDLGRWHSAGEARQAVERALSVFDRVSLDLIYMRPGQTPQAWADELASALSLGVDHVSLYELTIEPGTAFERKVRRGILPETDDERGAAFFETTNAVCAAAGFEAYETSNYVRAGSARSAHNLIYWRSGDWAGIGPGAHGRFTDGNGARVATQAARRPEDYITAVVADGWGVVERETLDASAQLEELLLMGLRLGEGVPLARIAAVAPLDETKMRALEADGWLETRNGALTVPGHARGLVDRIVLELVSP